jgi:hypothetical protein
VIASWQVRALVTALLPLFSCNSDVPVSAVAEIASPKAEVTVTRVATHPFLARFNLTLTVKTPDGCSTTSEMFPDTGGVSRRNLYHGPLGRLYLVGQFDVRRFDPAHCHIELLEFRSLDVGLIFAGSFDVDALGHWMFLPADARPERPFQPL